MNGKTQCATEKEQYVPIPVTHLLFLTVATTLGAQTMKLCVKWLEPNVQLTRGYAVHVCIDWEEMHKMV